MFGYQRVYIWKMNLVNWDSMGGSPVFFFSDYDIVGLFNKADAVN